MSQERLNGLAILSIEKHMLEQIDFNSLIIDFYMDKNSCRQTSTRIECDPVHPLRIITYHFQREGYLRPAYGLGKPRFEGKS